LTTADYLVVMDFDGTVADTFKPGPGGLGVTEAYQNAVSELFGAQGPEVFDRVGGLQNRTPGELIQHMLSEGPFDNLVDSARAFHERHVHRLGNCVPAGKGLSLEWDDNAPAGAITELLVRLKLSYLMEQVGAQMDNGSCWPQQCSGLASFLDAISWLNRHHDVDILVAIISSGHEQFIRRTFCSWGLPVPPIMLSDDDLRGMGEIESHRRVKPSPFLMTLVHKQWARIRGLRLDQAVTEDMRSHTVMCGDDWRKDGGLAQNCGVPFLWFNPTGAKANDLPEPSVGFRCWTQPAGLLASPETEELLSQGGAFSDIVRQWQRQVVRV